MKISTKELVISAIFTAIIVVSCFISIPLPVSPVPITGQTFAIMLIGFILSPKLVLLSIGTYIMIGSIGIPVFAGFQGGFHIIAGPTGGYIFGFLIGAIVISYIKGNGKNIYLIFASGIAGTIIIHIVGTMWLAIFLKMPFASAAMIGSIPYIIGDIIKLVIAGLIAIKLNRQNILKLTY